MYPRRIDLSVSNQLEFVMSCMTNLGSRFLSAEKSHAEAKSVTQSLSLRMYTFARAQSGVTSEGVSTGTLTKTERSRGVYPGR